MRTVDAMLSFAVCMLELVKVIGRKRTSLPIARDHGWVANRTINTHVLPLSYRTSRIGHLLMLHSLAGGVTFRWVLVKQVLALPAW